MTSLLSSSEYVEIIDVEKESSSKKGTTTPSNLSPKSFSFLLIGLSLFLLSFLYFPTALSTFAFLYTSGSCFIIVGITICVGWKTMSCDYQRGLPAGLYLSSLLVTLVLCFYPNIDGLRVVWIMGALVVQGGAGIAYLLTFLQKSRNG